MWSQVAVVGVEGWACQSLAGANLARAVATGFPTERKQT